METGVVPIKRIINELCSKGHRLCFSPRCWLSTKNEAEKRDQRMMRRRSPRKEDGNGNT